jgi:hypothetical protein
MPERARSSLRVNNQNQPGFREMTLNIAPAETEHGMFGMVTALIVEK